MEGSQNLMNLLYACHLGENTELVSQADDSEDHDEVYYLHLAAPKRVSEVLGFSISSCFHVYLLVYINVFCTATFFPGIYSPFDVEGCLTELLISFVL